MLIADPIRTSQLRTPDILNLFKNGKLGTTNAVGVTELCPYRTARRIDAFFLSQWDKETMGFEIKVSRADFLGDKKWQEYLKFCTRFYFVAPRGIIKVEELPKNIGLIEVYVGYYSGYGDNEEMSEDTKFEIFTEYVKKCKKMHDIDEKDYQKVLEAFVYKLIYEKNLL